MQLQTFILLMMTFLWIKVKYQLNLLNLFFSIMVKDLTLQLPIININPSSYLMTPENEKEIANSINRLENNGNKFNIISSNVLKVEF